MSLSIGGVAVPVREASCADVKGLFTELGNAYGLDAKVVNHLVDTVGVQDLIDFLRLFTDHKGIGEFVEKVVGLDKKDVPLQTARLRRAWQAVTDTAADADKLKSKQNEGVDLDTPLPKPELDRLREVFWRRHRQQWPVHLEPSDALLSRTAREFTSRLLTIRPVAKSHSMLHQATNSDSKGSPGEDVGSVQRYLLALRVLIHSYSIAGATPLASASGKTEAKTSDATEFVVLPMDTAYKYFYRAEMRAIAMLERFPQQALKWLTEQDEAERAEWVQTVRTTQLTIGEVIEKVFREREPSWRIPEAPVPAPVQYPPRDRAQPKNIANPRAKGDAKADGKGKKRQGPENIITCKTLQNGKEICGDFNLGKCSASPCPHNKVHVCSRQCQRGRACGMSNHVAKDCKNKSRTF